MKQQGRRHPIGLPRSLSSPPDVTDGPGLDLKTFPIQLIDVFSVHVEADRGLAPSEEGPLGNYEIELATSPLSEDRHAFSCRLQVTSRLRLGDQVSFSAIVTIQGNFWSEAEIADGLREAFVARTPIVLLWPYARAYFSDLGRLCGLAVPPLPTLDALPTAQTPLAPQESEG